MSSLSSHTNVWNTCLQILHRRGYRARVVLDPEDGADRYVAEKDEFDFAADNPIELLGLIAIFEEVRPTERRPYWWVVRGDGPDRERLIDEATARRAAREKDLEDLRQALPESWVLLIRGAMENSGGLADAAAQLGISAEALRRMTLDPLLQ